MKNIVSLRDVVNEMEGLNHDLTAFLNKRTGELITLSEEDLSLAEDDVDVSDCPAWQQEVMEKVKEVVGSDEYLPLPTAFDIHEYRIMQEFCYAVEDEQTRERLLDSISGRGAFRRFKDLTYRLGIEADWFRFRREEYERIAVTWLDENGIAYTQVVERA